MSSKSNLWLASACVPIVAALQARGEDRVSYGHETYVEDDGRMRVDTESALFRKTLSPWFDLSGGAIYDSISGATPIGAPPLNNIKLFTAGIGLPVPNKSIKGFTRNVDAMSGASPASGAKSGSRNDVPTAESRDYRTSLNLAGDFTFGPNRISPSLNYSHEKDYVLYAGALNYAIDLNEKNTTVNAGWSHSSDVVRANEFTFLQSNADKNSDDFVMGVTQLLSPKTILNISGTIGYAHGYLNDPYRAVVFQETALTEDGLLKLYGEKRPGTRNTQAIRIDITQAVDRLNGSVEASYRYYHDSFDNQAHTVEIAWFQKLGRFVIVSPSFRYYFQEGANFYATQFAGDPVAAPAKVPEYYSSDYRISHFDSYTIGIDATWKVHQNIDLRAGYH